jgi:hypothetical protein
MDFSQLGCKRDDVSNPIFSNLGAQSVWIMSIIVKVKNYSFLYSFNYIDHSKQILMVCQFMTRTNLKDSQNVRD